MARCPVCETKASDHWLRGFLIGLFMALLIGFIGGQFFHAWQYVGPMRAVIANQELKVEEFKKGYVPVQPGKTK